MPGARASIRSVSGDRYNRRAVAASIEEFSYELTTGALAEHERALNALRTRTGTIVSRGSVKLRSFLAEHRVSGMTGRAERA